MKKSNLSSASGNKIPRLIKIGMVFCPCFTLNMDGSITFHLFRPVHTVVVNDLLTVEYIPMADITHVTFITKNYITQHHHQTTINHVQETHNTTNIESVIGSGTGNVSNMNMNNEQ